MDLNEFKKDIHNTGTYEYEVYMKSQPINVIITRGENEMKPKYATSISLNEEDMKMLEKCKKEGYSIIDIFRLGLQEALEQIEYAEEMGG